MIKQHLSQCDIWSLLKRSVIFVFSKVVTFKINAKQLWTGKRVIVNSYRCHHWWNIHKQIFCFVWGKVQDKRNTVTRTAVSRVLKKILVLSSSLSERMLSLCFFFQMVHLKIFYLMIYLWIILFMWSSEVHTYTYAHEHNTLCFPFSFS